MNFPPGSLPDLAPAYLSHLRSAHTVYYDAFPAPLPHGSYGVDQTSAFTLQARLSGGQVAPMQSHAPHPFSLSTAHPSHAQFDIGSGGNSQFASASASVAPAEPASMGPPGRPRKRKAPTLRADAWEPYKKRILDLHIVQKVPLPKVRQMIEEDYGFKAELRQYRTRVSQWGKDKNVKPQEMEAIVRKRQKRKLVETNKRPLVFKVRGVQVESQKIERWMKRYDVAESFLYAPSPTASTPSAVGCHTISERGSPATISVYSPPASVWSPGGIYLAAQSPQMPSPAPSVSSIVRPQASAFVGQSPAMAHRSLVELPPSFAHDPSTVESEMDVDAQPRYKQDEEERLRDQIGIAEITFMDSSSETLGMRYKLGSVLMDQGRYKAAEDIVRRLVESYENQSGNDNDGDDIEMLNALDLLGLVLHYQGLYVKAERLFRRAIQGSDKVLGTEHPDTLTSVDNLGSVFSRQGKYKEAEAMHRRALGGKEKVLGVEHPDTLTSVNNLGLVLWRQGKYEEAEVMHRRDLAGSEKALGVEHPDTLTSVNNLGSVLESQGKYEEAEAMHRRALGGDEKVLGVEHPDTLTSVSNLGWVLESQGKYEEAEAMHRRALGGREKVLGVEHPDTLISVGNLGWVLESQGKYEEAETMHRRALGGREKVLGAEHPDTLTSMANLASTF